MSSMSIARRILAITFIIILLLPVFYQLTPLATARPRIVPKKKTLKEYLRRKLIGVMWSTLYNREEKNLPPIPGIAYSMSGKVEFTAGEGYVLGVSCPVAPSDVEWETPNIDWSNANIPSVLMEVAVSYITKDFRPAYLPYEDIKVRVLFVLFIKTESLSDTVMKFIADSIFPETKDFTEAIKAVKEKLPEIEDLLRDELENALINYKEDLLNSLLTIKDEILKSMREKKCDIDITYKEIKVGNETIHVPVCKAKYSYSATINPSDTTIFKADGESRRINTGITVESLRLSINNTIASIIRNNIEMEEEYQKALINMIGGDITNLVNELVNYLKNKRFDFNEKSNVTVYACDESCCQAQCNDIRSIVIKKFIRKIDSFIEELKDEIDNYRQRILEKYDNTIDSIMDKVNNYIDDLNKDAKNKEYFVDLTKELFKETGKEALDTGLILVLNGWYTVFIVADAAYQALQKVILGADYTLCLYPLEPGYPGPIVVADNGTISDGSYVVVENTANNSIEANLYNTVPALVSFVGALASKIPIPRLGSAGKEVLDTAKDLVPSVFYATITLEDRKGYRLIAPPKPGMYMLFGAFRLKNGVDSVVELIQGIIDSLSGILLGKKEEKEKKKNNIFADVLEEKLNKLKEEAKSRYGGLKINLEDFKNAVLLYQPILVLDAYPVAREVTLENGMLELRYSVAFDYSSPVRVLLRESLFKSKEIKTIDDLLSDYESISSNSLGFWLNTSASITNIIIAAFSGACGGMMDELLNVRDEIIKEYLGVDVSQVALAGAYKIGKTALTTISSEMVKKYLAYYVAKKITYKKLSSIVYDKLKSILKSSKGITIDIKALAYEILKKIILDFLKELLERIISQLVKSIIEIIVKAVQAAYTEIIFRVRELLSEVEEVAELLEARHDLMYFMERVLATSASIFFVKVKGISSHLKLSIIIPELGLTSKGSKENDYIIRVPVQILSRYSEPTFLGSRVILSLSDNTAENTLFTRYGVESVEPLVIPLIPVVVNIDGNRVTITFAKIIPTKGEDYALEEEKILALDFTANDKSLTFKASPITISIGDYDILRIKVTYYNIVLYKCKGYESNWAQAIYNPLTANVVIDVRLPGER